MIFQLYHASLNAKLRSVSESGAENGCPFCRARLEKHLTTNDVIVQLAGPNAGKKYEVVEKSSLGGEWHCREQIENPDGLYALTPNCQLYLKLPLPAIPNWMLSLCVEDCCLVDDVLMRIVSFQSKFGTMSFDLKHLSHLISFCWLHRIPIQPEELCNLLEAHGHPVKMRIDTLNTIMRGTYLLTFANGKSAIKRRKMKPFKFFRYEPNIDSPAHKNLRNWLYGPPVKYSDLEKV